MNKLLVILSFLIILSSCEKNSSDSHEVFIAGLTFGECGGNCEHFFKLQDDQLFADDCDFCQPPSGILFQSDAISDAEKRNRMNDLSELIPAALLSSNETIFGCPDCGDWGAIHIILRENDNQKHYVLDNMIDGNPSELRAFALATRETIQFLQN